MGQPRSFPERRWERYQAAFRDEKRARHRARVLSSGIGARHGIGRSDRRDGRGCQARNIVRGEQCWSQAPVPRSQSRKSLPERVSRNASRGAICCIVRPHRSRELLRASGVGVERTCRFEHCSGGVSRGVVWRRYRTVFKGALPGRSDERIMFRSAYPMERS